MPEIRDALSELTRLGLHLDPAANAAEEEARRVRLNTRLYPLYRVIGYQLLLGLVLVHNLAVFGEVGWRAFLWFALISEVYAIGALFVVRRWFLRVPIVAGWDLADHFFLADLLLWAGAILVTGGTASWLFFLPLVRVADHRGVPHAYTFAVAAPITYLLVVLYAAVTGDVAWPQELAKALILGMAGSYIAFTARDFTHLQEQRAAALKLASQLLGGLRERTERLDQANRARSDLLSRVRDGLGAPLVEIVGFSQSLLRGVQRSASEYDYLQRIHQQARWVLRILEDLPDLPDVSSRWPRVSLTGVLQEAVAREATRGPTPPRSPRCPAELDLPSGDVEIQTEPKQLGALVEHLLSAARHFGGEAPSLELRLDPVTSIPERVEVVAPLNGSAEAMGRGDLMNPFAAAVAGDQQEMGARFELSLARSLSDALGYRLDLEDGAGRLRLSLRLR